MASFTYESNTHKYPTSKWKNHVNAATEKGSKGKKNQCRPHSPAKAGNGVGLKK